MPRPLRIEFDNAWYHVSNKGAGGRAIFASPSHTQLFMSLLQECIDNFDIEIHGFCFLPTAYHLLIKTRRANLSQAMRHLNGLYTQRFNKQQNMEGPLFKGRYRAIVLEDRYVLPISRYINLQPVAHQLVQAPNQYKWSSFRAHIGKPHAMAWLQATDIASRCPDYAAFVAEGVDPEVDAFYLKKKQPSVLGGFQFKMTLAKPGNTGIAIPSPTGPAMDVIMRATAQQFQVPIDQLTLSRRGQVNIPRSAAIYLSRKIGRHILTDIAATYSGITHAAVGTTVKRFQLLLDRDPSLRDTIECIIHNLKQQTAPVAPAEVAMMA